MTNHIPIIRGTGWSSITGPELVEAYSKLQIKLSKQSTPKRALIKKENPGLAPTQAEAFGAYVRELYSIYNVILQEMKISRSWVALQVHSTYHSKIISSDFTILGSENDSNQIQIRGMSLDPLLFNFPWEDNTMTHPWMPWGWKIDILPEDPDDTHYFFNLDGEEILAAHNFDGACIEFFNWNPNFSEAMNSFELK